MKKVLFTLSAIAIGFAFSTSCQKEVALIEQPTVKEQTIMTVNADAVATKTFIEALSGTEYNLKWSKGDAIACYEVGVVEEAATIQGKVTSSALADNTSSAYFNIDLSGNTADPKYSYIFVYPADKYSKSGENYRAQISDKQVFSATSFDKKADVLISRAIMDQTSRPTSVNAEFERIGATALMNIKAPTTTEKIRSITFSTTETSAYLTGYVKVYPLAGTHDTEIYSGERSITLTPAAATTYTGTIPVWFRLGEISLSNNFTVVVTTNRKIYTKVVNLESASRTLEFKNSGLTKFNVNMESVEGVDNPSLDDGSYYIVAKYAENYYAMSSAANGSRLNSVQLDDFDPTAESYLSNNEALEWTITNNSDAITIEHGSGTYLTPGDKEASTGNKEKTYTLASGNASGTLLLNSVNKSGYGLRYNSGSKWFAFYNSEVSATMIGDIYFMPKDSRTRVTAPTEVQAEAEGSTITIIWEDVSDPNVDRYLVKLSGTASDSQYVNADVESYEFTGLSDGTYSVSVESVPSNSTLYTNSLPVTISSLVVGSVDTYTKCSGTLTSGWYVIGNVSGNTVYAINNTVGTSWIKYTEVTASNTVITNPTDNVVWYYDASAGTIKNKDNTNYIYWTSGSNNGCCGTTSYAHTVTESTTEGIYIVKSATTNSRVLRRSGTSGYRYYTSNTGTDEICFFKKN